MQPPHYYIKVLRLLVKKRAHSVGSGGNLIRLGCYAKPRSIPTIRLRILLRSLGCKFSVCGIKVWTVPRTL